MPIVDLATLKLDMRLEGSAEDALLERLLAQASAAVVEHLGYPVERAARTYAREIAAPARAFGLPFMPVHEITALAVDGAEWPAADYAVTIGGMVRARNARWFFGEVVVSFVSGWRLEADGDTPRDLPSTIEAAVVGLVRTAYHEGKRDPSLRSESVPGVYSASFVAGGAGAHALGMLEPYRLPRIA